MPTARPSISATVGTAESMSTKPVTAVIPRIPMHDADQRGQQRQPGGDERAEGDREHERRDGEADDLADAADRGLGGDRVTAELDLHAGVACGLGGGLDGLDRALGEIVRRRRPVHLRERDAPVLGRRAVRSPRPRRAPSRRPRRRRRRPLRVPRPSAVRLQARRTRSGPTRRWPPAAAARAGRSPAGTRCPGIVAASVVGPLSVAAATNMPPSRTSQTASVDLRRRKAVRPSL